MGKLFLGLVTATNKTTGARSDKLAMIAGCSRANFGCRVAMSKSARYVPANCFLVIAPWMIVWMANNQSDAEFLFVPLWPNTSLS